MNVYTEETNAAGTVSVTDAGQIHVQGLTHGLPLNPDEVERLAQVLLEASAAARKALTA